MKLAELFITLGLDPGEFEKGVKEVIKESKKLKTQTSKDAQEVSGIWKKVMTFSLGNFMYRGVSAAISSMGKMAKQGIAMASDLEEVQNVVDKTFTKMSASIDTWAKSAMSSFGMGELAAKQYVSTMGAMLKSMGLSEMEFYDMSTALTRLAGDMASFYNLDHEDAFNKIRSGISGETEPLKQLGINMSVANLEAFALAEGIEKAYSQMSQSEQVMLRYNYLMNATSDAQGDFAQTIDSYANQSRLLSENWDKLWTNIGSLFTPMLTNVLEGINSLFGTENKSKTEATALTESFVQTSAQIGVTHARAEALIGVLEELEAAGVDTADEQLRWNTTLEELQELLPGISSLIDQETNSIIGGTNALREFNEEWKENAITAGKAEYLEELYKGYGRKLAERQDLQAQYDAKSVQFEADNDQLRVAEENLTKTIDDQVSKMYDKDTKYIWNNVIKNNPDLLDAVLLSMQYPEWYPADAVANLFKEGRYGGVKASEEQAGLVEGFLTEAFTREKYPSAFIEIDAVKDAGLPVIDDMVELDEQIEGLDIELEDYKRRIENFDATLEKDTDLTEEQSAAYRNVASSITMAADATDGLFDAEPAMEENITLTEEMAEAYTSMAESVIKAVDSMASGWGRAERVGTQSARTTVRNLKSQLDQLNQYNEQLDILRDSGYFSEEMLAMLASGGAENMAVTAGFAKEVQRAQKGNASSVENLEAASSYYEQIAAAKADLAETMLEMKLTVDEDSLSGAIVTGMSGLALNVNVNASALADALTPFISANIARDNTTSGKTGG